ncbi:non-ribosomal peptide synthetase [Podospora conica]|nr:non-ribosomal peptide synthetase [Schizothecium conicum]
MSSTGVRTPATPISAATLLLDDPLLSVVNHPASRQTGPCLLHDLVKKDLLGEEVSAIAHLSAGDTQETLSYAQLHEASDLLAARITELAKQFPPQESFIIPVLLPQSIDLYISLLGILKAGAAFCPLNLDIPTERAKFILDDVTARIVITSPELSNRIPNDDGARHVLLTNGGLFRSLEVPDSRNCRQPQPTDLAYVMYTSGSTGTPKGVGVSHDAATQSLLAHDRHIPAFSRFLQFAAPTFDVSVFEIFFPLFRGRTLVSCERSILLNDLPAVINTMEVDGCELTPTVARSLLRNRASVPCLRLLLTIGEMLTKPVVEEFGGANGRPSILWAMYGPTEAAIHCTIQPSFQCSSLVNDIGIPLDSVSAMVLPIADGDSPGHGEFRILPRGEEGELAIGGHQLAQGYLNRPEQTAAAFIDTPYGKLYRTGDKARMHVDGTLECLGRISNAQVKLRGQRIELGEIEHTALRTSGCHGAVAAVVNNILVLFCGGDDPRRMESAILESCKQWLSGYMVPGDVVVMKEFPRLSSGKVDRKLLVANYTNNQHPSDEDKIQAQTELECLLCNIATQVLGTNIVPGQNLLRAGLDSLMAIKFASALRGAGQEVDVVDVLASSSVSDLEIRILERQNARMEAPVAPNEVLSPRFDGEVAALVETLRLQLGDHNIDIEHVLPCTPLQTSMLAETVANPTAYCNWVKLELPGDYTASQVRSWFLQIVGENEALRSCFVHRDGQFLHVILRELDASTIQVRDMDGEAREFSMDHEDDFLRPLRVYISSEPVGGSRSVDIQLHHAVYDGWSMDLIVADLGTLAQGAQLKPRPQFRQISDFYGSSSFQRACESAKEFWADTLTGYQPPQFPILSPDLSIKASTHKFSLPIDISPESVKDLDYGAQTLFQSALAWLWGSVTGCDDFVIGVVASGRSLPVAQIEDVIGPCITSIPIRTDLSQLRSIHDLLSSTHASNRAALPHGVLPLAEIKRMAGIRPGQALYDVLFVYQESLASRQGGDRLVKQVDHQDFLETKLLVEVEPTADGYVCLLTGHSDTFSKAQMEVMCESIRAITRFMVGNQDSALGAIQEAFPSHLLSIYNPSPTPFTGVPDLAYAVESVANKHPEKDAICFAHRISEGSITSTSISFRGLNAMANQIARHIQRCAQSHGVRKGDAVAIMMEKSILLYAGILGILKAGYAYLPLLPTTPSARVEAILKQASVNLCIVDAHKQPKINWQCEYVVLDEKELSVYETNNLNIDPDPSRLSYIIFTSGSTGIPKGVCLTQLNIMSNLDALSKIYPVQESSRMLQSCSQAFDVSVFEIFFAWTQGMCLCSATNDTLFEDLESSIRRLGVTHLSMTPTVASLIDPESVPKVEFLVTAGEAMTEVVAKKWVKQLYQGYGPSETTNICSVKKMRPGQVVQHLGWSFDNTSTFVLEKGGAKAVPLGCFGEFVFGGDQVAQGYLNLADQTSAKFIHHPTFGRIYRSGDLGRMLPDGSMVISGRVDEQIKIRGQRVELDEITTILRCAEAVADCATLFIKGGSSAQPERIISFIVPSGHHDAHTYFQTLELDDTLRTKIRSLFVYNLAERLPAYMVPSYLVPISVLPTTASGKLDRKRLIEAVEQLDPDYLASISPVFDDDKDHGDWSTMEQQLVEVVCSTFKVENHHLQRWTPLSTVGLDSISAIEFARKIQQKLGKRVAISEILQNPNIKRLAQALGDGSRHNVVAVLDLSTELHDAIRAELLLPTELSNAIRAKVSPQAEVEQILPCTPLQEAMLATSSGRGSYLNRMLFEVRGDIPNFFEAWRTVCRRHGILRTCFASTPDSRYPIVQVVLSDWEAPIQITDSLDTSDAAQVDQCISEQIAAVPEAIDSMTPTVSFAVIRDASKCLFSFVCHHALYDGVAMERVLFEVEQLMKGASLAPPPAYAPFLNEAMTLPSTTENFWGQHLRALKPHALSQIRVDDPSAIPLVTSRNAAMPLSFISGKTKQLGISLLSLAQATWAAVLAVSLRNLDVCFGNVVSGRSLPLDRLDELVGPCFNTIPIRMDLARQPRCIDLIKAFQALNLDLAPYQFTPLRRIQAQFSRHDSRRLFDTLLLLQHPSRELDDKIWALRRDEGEMDVMIPDTARDRLVVKLHVEAGHLSPEWAELVQDLFSFFLQSCTEFSASRLPAFESLPQELKQRLERFPVEQLVVEPEAEQRTPEDTSRLESWTATESTVRNVLSALSEVDVSRIQRQTSIYRLGLDSISAVQIASLLRNQGLKVSASDVISNPTCERLAQFLDDQQTTPSNEGPSAGPDLDLAVFRQQIRQQIQAQGIPLDSLDSVLPCTPMQEGIMAQFIKSAGKDYLSFLSFRLDGHLTGASVANAWRTLCDVHPILRTGFIPIEHERFSFAMLQYQSRDFENPVAVTQCNHGEDFDIAKWHLDASQDILHRVHKHPWSVMVVETDQGCMMHLAIHHSLYDAYSFRVLVGDLAKILGGGEIAPRPGSEAALLQILSSASSLTEEGGAFWRQQADKAVVNGFPVMTPLREKERRILIESSTSKVAPKTLEKAVASSGHTLQAALQAAWTRILAAYLGEASVVFGVVLSGRTTEATRDAVFPCITALPVVSTNVPKNRDLLDQMLAYNSELFKQQQQSLTRIQQWLGYPNARPFDTLLLYQKFDQDRSEPLPWTLVDEVAAVQYPVAIEIENSEHGTLEYTLTYFSDVLPAEQASLLLAQFDATLCDLLFSPDADGGDLIKNAPEIFSVLPAEKPELPSPVQLLHQLVEVQAAATPDKTALYFVDRLDAAGPSGRSWTYHDLNANGNRVANALAPFAKVGDIVAVDFDKCPEAFFSILGILKAGCSFVALDPGAPEARKDFILKDSGATVLLTANMDDGSRENPPPVPVLQIHEEFLQTQSAEPVTLCREIQPGDVCYCLYTSGTTGTPKGCEITHDNAVQCMLAFQHIFEGHWDESSRWLQFASLHFDVSVLEQYWSWSVGITLVAAPRYLLLDDLAKSISKLDITHIDLTPSLARLLHPDDVPSLCRGVFITGGESLKQEILDVWGSKAVIYNFYGPTEATIGVTVFPRVPTNGRASNIGRQFINVGSYVLRPGTDIPVLRGAVGELCVSGRLVGKGYLNREALTAERFPTLTGSGERVYRTGDLVRVLHDGCFDFLGRADDQVKLRGQRLEIGEINHAIRTGVEGVNDVATVVVRNEKQQKDFLVSFLVVDQGGDFLAPIAVLTIIATEESSNLCRRARIACQSRLPGYMVPTYVFQLPLIPLSRNNKADVKELRRLFNKLSPDELVWSSSSAQASKSSTSLTETGRIVSTALAAMLSVESSAITPSSNIFELGIDSISVLRLSRGLREAGLVQASPAVVMRHPIIQDLAQVLETPESSETAKSVANAWQLVRACSHGHKTHVCKELGVRPDEIEYIAPCSPLQQGMISRSGDDGMYFNSFRFKLAKQARAQDLWLAWQRLVAEHAILRTAFVETIEGCVQVALKQHTPPWTVHEIGAEESLEELLGLRKREWISRNANGIRSPCEMLLVTSQRPEGEGDRILVLHIFHGLYDGNSLKVLMRRLWEEYGASEGLTRPQTPSFLDALCHGPLQNYNGSKRFWVEHLAGWSSSSTRAIIGKAQDGAAVSCRYDMEISIEWLRTKLAVTHQAILQAAWVSVLTNRLSLVPTIGIIASGRAIDLDGVDDTAGPLFNTLPFLANVSPKDSTFHSVIRACHEFNTATLGFQHVPLRDVQKWCSGGKPLFDSLFSFQREEAHAEEGEREWTELESEVVADYPLAFEATLDTDGWLSLLLVSQGDKEQLEDLMVDLAHVVMGLSQSADEKFWEGGSESDQESESIENGRDEEEEGGFVWTADARSIQEEIALLADVSPELVKETTALFELGLDSIDVIKLAARLKQRGIVVKTSHLIKAQTIAAVMQLLSKETDRTGASNTDQHSGETDVISAFRERLVTNGQDLSNMGLVFPTTPLQDSMVTEMVHSGFQLYFNHDVLEIGASVDVQKLMEAWNTVIAASPILQTTFMPVEDPELKVAYCQIIRASSPTVILHVELDSIEELPNLMDSAVERAREGDAQRNLLQLICVTIGGQRFLVLSMAHALYDGWSLGLLHRDVVAAYHGRFIPRPPYESYLRDVFLEDKGEATKFWSGFLEGATPSMFPLVSPQTDTKVVRSEAQSSLPVSDLKLFCKQHAITLQTLGQACWAAIVATKTKSLDVSFGVVLSGRDTPEAEEIMFPTMNTVAVRSILHGTVGSWLRYMQDNMAGVAAVQGFPLREAQKLVGGDGGALFNSLFIQQKSGGAGVGGEEALMKSVGGEAAVDYPVCVEMEVSEDNLVWRLACDGRYTSHDGTAGLLGELDVVLRHILDHPDAEVLAFTGPLTSVCELPAFMAEQAMGISKPNHAADEEDETEWSPVEDTIRTTLSEVSGVTVSSVLKTHSIYHLGLDSISAIKVSGLLKQRGVHLAFRDMLRAKSISEMALLVEQEPSTQTPEAESETVEQQYADEDVDDALALAGIAYPQIEEVLPATAMQVHMLSVWQNTEGRVFYPEFTFRLPGPLDAGTVFTRWSELVKQTPILRTTFVATPNKRTPIIQVITKVPTGHLYTCIDVHQDGDSCIVSLKIHHARYDAISLPVLIDALSGRSTGSWTPTTTAKHALAWSHVTMKRLEVARERFWTREGFWTEYLGGAITQPHPTSKTGDNTRVSTFCKSVLPSISHLKSACSKRGLSIQALFFAAYAKFLASSNVTGITATEPKAARDVIFGIYLANRIEGSSAADLLPTYPTLALVPLRVHFGSEQEESLLDVAERVQRNLHDISDPTNVAVGLWEIQEWTGVVVDSFVNFLGATSGSHMGGGGMVEFIEPKNDQGAESTEKFREPEELAGNMVRDAYPDAVDVEVAIRGESMDIGVFGSRARLGHGEGKEVIDGVVDILRGIV